jgi:glycerophosphoryl diester phosphodiesterase
MRRDPRPLDQLGDPAEGLIGLVDRPEPLVHPAAPYRHVSCELTPGEHLTGSALDDMTTSHTLKPYLDAPGPIAFAHRGAHDGADVIENTMTAFTDAVDLGYRYIETDVHATADGVLVAFHDDRLDRVTDRVGLIRDLPWREVRAAVVGEHERIPLLEDVLATWRHLHINIDPKHHTAVEPLVSVIERTGAIDRICVGSFSDRRTAHVRAALGRRLCTAMGPVSIGRLRAASRHVPLGRVTGDCAQVPVRQGRITIVDEHFLQAAHVRGIAVHVWTIDDPVEMDRLLDLGVDGIMTDQATVLRAAMERRGVWRGSAH